jgi:D-3-phosphoglycerate dehydrogenase
MNRILITPRSLTAAPGQALCPLEDAGFELVFSPAGRQPSEEELSQLVPGCLGWLAGVEPITARVLDKADALRVISRNGSGTDSIDLAAAERRGVKIRIAPGANATAVAELTLAFIICGLRGVPESATALKAGTWRRSEGREIDGTTIGLIGCGAVGRAVAQALASLGAAVLAYDIAPVQDFQPSGRFLWADLDHVLAESDVVSLHCPALAAAAVLLGSERIARMKHGVGLVNTARASLVDEAALLLALNEGRVGWYATDVFEREPPGQTPLVVHKRVLATPHIGGFTTEGGRRAVRVAVANLLAELKGMKRQATEALAS